VVEHIEGVLNEDVYDHSSETLVQELRLVMRSAMLKSVYQEVIAQNP